MYTNRINVRKLRKQLTGGSDKLPKMLFRLPAVVELTNVLNEPVCRAWVWIITGINNPRRQHRVRMLCPKCQKDIPVGRYAQHHKVHERQNREFDKLFGIE